MTADYQLLTDEQLIEKLNQKDQRAFEEIYNRYWLSLYNHARKLLKDDDEAADMVQDLFTNILNKMGALNFNSTLPAFLFQSIRNRVINHFQHDQVKHKYVSSLKSYINNVHSTADLSLREREMAERIAKEIEALPPKMREVFELSRKSYLNSKEIADITNISEATVKKHLVVALKRLRTKLTILFSFLGMFSILWLNRFLD